MNNKYEHMGILDLLEELNKPAQETQDNKEITDAEVQDND